MRTESEVLDFRAQAFHKYVSKCKICNGESLKCQCRKNLDYAISAYEACIPRDFWNIKEEKITHNRSQFELLIKPYVVNLNKALKNGYGMLFTGDNGVGKTFFMSYILCEAIKKGRTAYFTNMPDLDYNIKRGFNDKHIEERLRYMLTSDFVAIDEMGKERFKKDPKYMDAQVERIMKKRIDDSLPMLLATNMSELLMKEVYGSTVSSMLTGKFKTVIMQPGDLREHIAERMEQEIYG
jgi:DNA replication protein DnaC